jgi:hypothetical protein
MKFMVPDGQYLGRSSLPISTFAWLLRAHYRISVSVCEHIAHLWDTIQRRVDNRITVALCDVIDHRPPPTSGSPMRRIGLSAMSCMTVLKLPTGTSKKSI